VSQAGLELGPRLAFAALVVWCLGGCGPSGNQQLPTGAPHNQPSSDHGPANSGSSPRGNVAHPSYLGGPVLQNARVVAIYWNSNVSFQPQIEAFYRVITTSAYFAGLAEYGTSNPRQTINYGSLVAAILDPGPPAGSLIRNSDIQQELSRLISHGQVPKNDADTVYMLHFPSGISIEFDGGSACADFCAYHTTYQINGTNVYYAVIPDMGGTCSSACGPSTQLGNTTAAASHELAEAVTDPAVGLAAGYGPPLGWYDQEAGEIGDICNGERSIIAGFTVQPVWSNALGRCRTF